ncbi:MAG: squalene synthase HpnC [Phycisphaerales bacterium]|nr:squalene synthase HpnC [Phycisphaerales bacterium]
MNTADSDPIDPRTPPVKLLERFGPSQSESISPEGALRYCRALARSHYENFSVLTGLVPQRLRDDFAAVYAFCRWSDDLGDELGGSDEARTRASELLAWWRGQLDACARGESRHPVYVALQSTIRRHGLPLKPFADLIAAFVQDQEVTRYQTFEQLIEYCARSADPVGRIVLHLGGYPDESANADRYRMSDATCTALQLTNFWQDVRRDLFERGRVYIPEALTGLSPESLRDFADRGSESSVRLGFIRSLRPLVARTWELFEIGRPLPRTLTRDIAPVVWLFGAGGRSVLEAVERCGCTTLWHRPRLKAMTKAGLLFRARLGLIGPAR